MQQPTNLIQVFDALRPMLAVYEKHLEVVHDEPHYYYLDTKHVMPNKKCLFFGAVQVKKAYTSFHLMPLYVFPHLLASISPALKRQMQGKACFNFRQVDADLFKELQTLVRAAYASYQRAGYAKDEI